MDCKGVSLGRSGSKGDGEVEGVDGLGSGGVSGGPLLPFEMVSWTALGNVNARGVGPSRVMSSMEWWVGKESARGVGERIAPWEWSYMDMDIVASVCSSIVACAAEREEEVRECIELLAKLFIGIGQQCRCARMRMQKGRRTKGGKDNNETKERQRKRRSKGQKGDKKLGVEG